MRCQSRLTQEYRILLFENFVNAENLSRGRGNRTPISGFGDRSPTIKRYPFAQDRVFGVPLMRPTLAFQLYLTL